MIPIAFVSIYIITHNIQFVNTYKCKIFIKKVAEGGKLNLLTKN